MTLGLQGIEGKLERGSSKVNKIQVIFLDMGLAGRCQEISDEGICYNVEGKIPGRRERSGTAVA